MQIPQGREKTARAKVLWWVGPVEFEKEAGVPEGRAEGKSGT